MENFCFVKDTAKKKKNKNWKVKPQIGRKYLQKTFLIKKTHLIKKWAKDLNRHLTKNIQMANKHTTYIIHHQGNAD